MQLLIALLILLPPTSTFNYTHADYARARQLADMKKFVGPRLPSPPRTPNPPVDRVALAAKRKPQSSEPDNRTGQVPQGKTTFDGTYFRDESGGVIAQRSGCRPCWAVRAGIHYSRCCGK